MKITKFFVVGTLNTSLAYLFFIFLVKLGVNYKIALLLDYIFGIIFGYCLNRYWTFYSNKHHRSFIKYITLNVGIFFLNGILLVFAVDYLFLDPIISQFLIIGFISLASYLLQNHWVFSRKKSL